MPFPPTGLPQFPNTMATTTTATPSGQQEVSDLGGGLSNLFQEALEQSRSRDLNQMEESELKEQYNSMSGLYDQIASMPNNFLFGDTSGMNLIQRWRHRRRIANDPQYTQTLKARGALAKAEMMSTLSRELTNVAELIRRQSDDPFIDSLQQARAEAIGEIYMEAAEGAATELAIAEHEKEFGELTESERQAIKRQRNLGLDPVQTKDRIKGVKSELDLVQTVVETTRDPSMLKLPQFKAIGLDKYMATAERMNEELARQEDKKRDELTPQEFQEDLFNMAFKLKQHSESMVPVLKRRYDELGLPAGSQEQLINQSTMTLNESLALAWQMMSPQAPEGYAPPIVGPEDDPMLGTQVDQLIQVREAIRAAQESRQNAGDGTEAE